MKVGGIKVKKSLLVMLCLGITLIVGGCAKEDQSSDTTEIITQISEVTDVDTDTDHGYIDDVFNDIIVREAENTSDKAPLTEEEEKSANLFSSYLWRMYWEVIETGDDTEILEYVHDELDSNNIYAFMCSWVDRDPDFFGAEKAYDLSGLCFYKLTTEKAF